MILDDANHPAVEGGVYVISYTELVDGYRHAYYDPAERRVRYSRKSDHLPDDRCPECKAKK